MLEVVAEQTGYPTDLLDMDLDLEADLGIDTVKQAEVFATIREAYGIERDDALKLRDYPTLDHVVAFVRERIRRRPEPRTPLPAEPAPRPAACRGDDVEARVLAVVAEQTGYPTDLLDMDLDLEADLGIDTVKQAEVFASIREAYGIERDDSLKLRDYPTLNHVVGVRARAAMPQAPQPVRHRPAPAERRAGARRCGRRRRGAGAGGGGRADRLSVGSARHGPGSGGRSGHRHGQAGGGVRVDP